MISLEEYLKCLKEYENNINLELQNILEKADTNFTYESIVMNSFKTYGKDYIIINLYIKKYNNGRDKNMEISCRDGRIETLTFQKEKFATAFMFENAKIDKDTLREIVMLAETYREFYENSLSYENIMRQLRHLPSHLPFYDRPFTESELAILKDTMLEKDKLPKFLFGHQK